MRIAVQQAAGTPGDVAANLDFVRHGAAAAAEAGARLVVFPECFLTGYALGARVRELAEPVDGPMVSALRAVPGVAVLCGYPERDGSEVYNSAVLVDGGEMLANYRKTHLFAGLDDEFVAGSEYAPLVELDGIKVGILICYDIEFPENARRLALAGAQLIAVPTALPSAWIAETLVPARAGENKVYVAYANRIGSEGDVSYAGRSCVAGIDGAVLRAPADREELLVADLDLDALARSRARFSYLDDRRPSLYDA